MIGVSGGDSIGDISLCISHKSNVTSHRSCLQVTGRNLQEVGIGCKSYKPSHMSLCIGHI